jgi:hypothetical protein
MRTFAIASPVILGGLTCFADLLPPVAPIALAPGAATNSVTLRAIDRGPHHTVFENILFDTNDFGQITVITNSYTELATALNYQNEVGQWTESKEIIELFNDGAVARQGQTRLIFAPNINFTNGAIDVLAPDGIRFLSRIQGIAFYDPASGKSAIIAQTKDSIGQLISDNEVLYADAFSGLQADVHYTYHKASLEQDVILRENPKLPDGFDPQFCRIQVWTEFFDPPSPAATTTVISQPADPLVANAMVAAQFTDQKLNFGQTEIGPGKAFSINGQPAEAVAAVPVGKSWLTIDGRSFLVEAVEYNSVKPLLATLPGVAAIQRNWRKNGALAKLGPRKANTKAELAKLFSKAPDRKRATLAAGRMRMAKANLGAEPGVVLDYVSVSTASYNNYVLASDTTYYVSGAMTLGGTTTIEGGTVIKFPAYNGAALAYLNISGAGANLNCLTAPYKPAVFTAKDDNTIGETISGSSGNPSGYYGYCALILDSSAAVSSLSNLRMRYAKIGIYYGGGVGHVLRHSQFVSCESAFQLVNNSDCRMRNILVYAAGDVLSSLSTSSTFRCENGTFDFSGALNRYNYMTVHLTNSLLVGIGTIGVYDGANNQVPPAGMTVFQGVGAGSHYLADNTYRNQGTAAIEPGLLADLRKRTTYPPTQLTANFSGTSILRPNAAVPPDTDAIDLGYHYDIIDYAWGGLTLNASAILLLTNGVAVANFGPTGTTLASGSQFISEGSPVKMNHLVRYNAVQENAAWGTFSSTMSLLSQAALPAGDQQVRMRFTDISFLSDTVYRRTFFNPSVRSTLALTDCSLRNVYLSIFPHDAGQYITIGLTNNLAQRLNCSIWGAT